MESIAAGEHAVPLHRALDGDHRRSASSSEIESLLPAAEDGFGPCATEVSEPRQIRKEAAIRRRPRAPQVNLSSSSAAGISTRASNMHVALARKWRPRIFEDLVGQEAVAKTLTHAIEAGRIAPAYLL